MANNLSTAKQKVQEFSESATDTTSQAGDVVKEVVQNTGEKLETGTNTALQFLGIPVDIDALTAISIDWSVRLVLAFLIFFVGKWVGKRIVKVARRIMERGKVDPTAANFLSNVLYGLMLVAVTLAALNKLGVNTNSFVAILGAAAVAIGMALKDQLGNLAAGVMIVIFRPFSRGDYVEISGHTGTITDITLVNTRIRTPNNDEITIPNGDIMTSATVNYSALPKRRVPVVVGIGYECDIKQARQLMLEQASAHAKVLKEPAPLVRVTALGDNAVDLTLYVWTDNDDWFAVQCDLLESIKYSFDEHNISIPFPQRSLHLESASELVLDAIKERQNSSASNSIT